MPNVSKGPSPDSSDKTWTTNVSCFFQRVLPRCVCVCGGGGGASYCTAEASSLIYKKSIPSRMYYLVGTKEQTTRPSLQWLNVLKALLGLR